MADKPEEVWELSGTTATYKIDGKTVLTVKGLPTGTTLNSEGRLDGLSITVNDDKTGRVVFGNDALKGSSKITLTPATGYNYDVSFNNTVQKDGVANVTSTVANGVLTIKGDITDGYRISADGKTISFISSKTNQTLATVKGLSAKLSTDADGSLWLTDDEGKKTESNAITVNQNNKTIILTNDVLDKKSVTFGSNSGFFKLVAPEEIQTVKLDGDLIGKLSKGTATITGKLTEGYAITDTAFTYSAAKEVTLAKITNLKSQSTTTDLIMSSENGKNVITLTEDDLAAKNATLSVTKGYEYLNFAMNVDSSLAPTDGEAYWQISSKGATAAYQKDTEAGWKVNENGNTIVYSKKTTTTLAKITGLAKTNTDGKYDPEKDEVDGTVSFVKAASGTVEEQELNGITVSDTDKKITLNSDALTTTKVSLTSTDYQLDLDGVNTTSTSSDPVWVVSKTTATLYNSNPAYYTLGNDKKSVTYTATATKEGNKALPALATLKNLASGLQVGSGADANKLYAVNDTGDKTLAVEITKKPSDVVGEITLHDGAQATSNITLTSNEYLLALDRTTSEEGSDKPSTAITAPQIDTNEVTWKVSGGTATMSAVLEPGFTLSADKKTATYVKPKNAKKAEDPQEVFSIKGLSKTFTDVDKIDVFTKGDDDDKIEASDASILVVKDPLTGLATVKVKTGALGTGNVTVTNNDYSLVLDDSVPTLTQGGDPPNPKSTWVINGTSATFENISPAYYTYDAAKNTIIYHKSEISKDVVTQKDMVEATITGFNDKIAKTFTVSEDGRTVYYTKTDSEGGEPETIPAFMINGTTITILSTDIFTTAVKLDQKKFPDYSLALAERTEKNEDVIMPAPAPPEDAKPTWTVSGTTATLKGGMTAGVTVTASAITKVAAKASGATLATVKGIKSGFKATTNDAKVGIVTVEKQNGKNVNVIEDDENVALAFDLEEGVITVNKLALDDKNKTTITIDSSVGYKLELDDDVANPTPDKYGWVIDTSGTNTNNVELWEGTSAGWQADEEGSKITYSPPDYSTALSSVKGLSKNVSLNENEQLVLLDESGNVIKEEDEDGNLVPVVVAKVDEEDDKLIILNPDALGKSNITVSNGYGLALMEGGENSSSQDSVWSLQDTTAILSQYTPATYTPKTNKSGKTIEFTYSAAKQGNPLATIKGLKSGLTLTSTGKIGVLDKNGNFTEAMSIAAPEDGDSDSEENDNEAKIIVANPEGENAVALSGKIILLTEDAIDKKKTVTLTPGEQDEEYQLGVYAKQKSKVNPVWSKSGTKATLKMNTTAGYRVSDDGLSLAYYTNGTTTTTISGLGTKKEDGLQADEDGKTTDAEIDGNKIILSKSAIGDSTSTIKLTSSQFVLDVDDSVALPVANVKEEATDYAKKTGVLTIKGTIECTGEDDEDGGWSLSDDAKTLSYIENSEEDITIATIKGLAKNLDDIKVTAKNVNKDGKYVDDVTAPNSGVVVDAGKRTITIAKDVLGTTNVTLAGVKGKYKLELADGVPGKVTGQAPANETVWRVSGTTATYKTVTPAYYTYDEKKNQIVYHKEVDVKNSTLATIKGLDKTKLAEAFDKETGEIKGIVVDSDTSLITISENVLGAANVTLTGTYKLLLDSQVPTTTNTVTEWVTSGTTASYKNYNTAFYTISSDNKSITYNKPKTGNDYATITGLKNGVVIEKESFNPNSQTLTLKKDYLDSKNVKITKGNGFKLAISDDIKPPQLQLADEDEVIAKTTKAVVLNGAITKGYTLTNDQLLTFVPAKGTFDEEDNIVTPIELVTISGFSNLTKGEDLSNVIELKTVSETDDEILMDADGNATILLKKSLFEKDGDGKSYVKGNLTVSSTAPYKLALEKDENDDWNVADETFAWNTSKLKSKGTLTYDRITTDSFEEASNGKSIIYTAGKTVAQVTISGLNKNLDLYSNIGEDDDLETKIIQIKNPAYADADADADIPEYVNAIEIKPAVLKKDGSLESEGTVTILRKEVFGGSKISIGTKENYKLVAGDAILPKDFTDGNGAKWYIKGTTATLKSGKSAGYELAANAKSISSVKETADSTVAEIKGLAKNLKVSAGDEYLIELLKDDTSEEDLEGENTVASNQIGVIKTKNIEIDGKKTTVKFFDPAIVVEDFTDSSKVSKVLKLNTNAVGTSNVTLTCPTGTYVLSGDNLDKPSVDPATWTIKNGTATLKRTTGAGFTLNKDGDTLEYSTGKANATIVTVSGLSKTPTFDGLSASGSKNAISIETVLNDGDVLLGKTVTVKNDMLGGNKVSIKSGTKGEIYTLKMGEDVLQKDSPNRTNQTEWVTSGTTATYKTYDKGYYSYGTKDGTDDQTTLVYTKDTAGTSYASITGLKKDAKIASADFDNKTKKVKLTEAMLGTSTLTFKTGDAYSFDASEVSGSFADYTATWSAANSSGKATYSGTVADDGAGFLLSADGRTFTYLKNKAKTGEIASVTGLRKDTEITPNNDGVITLDDDDLNKKAVTVKGSIDGKELTLDLNAKDYEVASLTGSSNGWNIKSDTGSLVGVVDEAGYTLSRDKKSITYTAETAKNKTTTFATIKGMNAALATTVDKDKKVVTVGSTDLAEKVTISGSFAFNFGSSYSNSTITGSTGTEDVTIGGTGLNVNLGKGNDYIDNAGSNNIFFYASGDGNDVIANFGTNDKINVTSGTLTAENIKIEDVDGDGNDDAVIVVGKGSIALSNYTNSITITDKTKTATYKVDNGCYIADVTSTASYAAEPTGDFSLTPTSLVKQGNAIAYSGGSDNKK